MKRSTSSELSATYPGAKIPDRRRSGYRDDEEGDREADRGEPKAFHLLFDDVNNRIGLKPTAPGLKNAYPVAKYGRHGGRLVRAYRLMQEFGIDLSDTVRFSDADVDTDGILVLDLRTAKISSRARRHRRPSTGPQRVELSP